MSYPAQSYENFMVPSLFAPWSSHLIQRANVQPGEHILDVACGTGIVSRQIALRGGSHGMVIGIDLNPNMLRMACVAAERDGLAIDLCTSQAEQLPFSDGSFDLIVCQFGLMFFTDRKDALMEMHRVLKPGGRVVLSVWQGLDHHPFYQTLHDVSRRHLRKSSVQAVFSLGDSAQLYKLLTDSGFQRVEIEPMSITARFPNAEEFLAWEIDVNPAEIPVLRDLDAQEQQTILSTIRQEMETPLREVMHEGQAVIPFHAHIAHATR